jgi:hypothetical protein
MRRVLPTVVVAALLTGCAGHIVKPEDNWVGEHDDRAGATAANIKRATVVPPLCAAAGIFAAIAVGVDAHEEASRMMHGACNADTFFINSKDIRKAVPDADWCRQTVMPCK